MSTRRDAEQRGDLEAEHRPEAVAARLAKRPNASYLRDVVYGAVDGTVTTFAIVAGVAGGGFDATVVLVLGTANLVADGFSMAAANYLGMRSEEQRHRRVRREERRHIELVPEGEREEVRQLLARDGFTGELLELATDAVTADPERWTDVMVSREHGLGAAPIDPLRAAMATFFAFILAGLLPLLTFILDALPAIEVPEPYVWSAGLSAVGFFGIGALAGRVAEKLWWRGAGRTLIIGGSAAALAYAVGIALGSMV